MYRFRKWLVGGLAAAMLMSVAGVSQAATVAGAPFTDVTASTSYAGAINALAATGVLNGYGNGQFLPENPLTRAEFTKIVVDLAGKGGLAASLANNQPRFTDGASVPTWAWGYVDAAVAMGIIKGYPDGSYEAGNNVTHAEAIAMLTRLLGDDWSVTGAWPDDYMLAGYNLGIVAGLSNVTANTPILRDEMAQMAYNAAFAAKYASSADTLSAGGGLYGENAASGTFPAAYTGDVTAVNSTDITLDAKDASGALAVASAPFAANVSLAGVTGFEQLLGLKVTLVEDASHAVDYVQASQGAGSASATLNDGTLTAAPSGYQTYAGGTTSAGVIVAVTDGNGNDYVLLKDGHVIELGASTQVFVNTAARPSFLPSAAAASLIPGAIVTYATQNGVATSLYESATTIAAGRVTAVDAASGTVTVAYMASKPEDSTVTLAVPAGAAISLDGSTATLGGLQSNDIVDIQTVGDLTVAGTAVASLSATRKVVSGSVTQVKAITGTGGPENTFTLQPAGTAPAVTLTEDSGFVGGSSLVIGDMVTVALDAGGNARAVIGTAAATSPVVRLTGLGTTMSPSGTLQTLTVDEAGSSVSLDTAGNVAPQTEVAPAGSPLQVGDFYVLTLQADGTVSSLGYLAPNAGNGHLTVYSVSPTAIVLQDGSGGYITVVSGPAYNAAGTYVGFTGLQTGDSVDLYADGGGHYAMQDQTR